MYTIIGYRDVNYTSKKTGKPVIGYNVYVTYSGRNVEGVACREFYISFATADKFNFIPHIGDVINLGFYEGSNNVSVIMPA